MTISDVGVTIAKIVIVIIVLIGLYAIVTETFIKNTSKSVNDVKSRSALYFGNTSCKSIIQGNYTVDKYTIGAQKPIKPLNEQYGTRLYVRVERNGDNYDVVLDDMDSGVHYELDMAKYAEGVYEGRIHSIFEIGACGKYDGELIIRFIRGGVATRTGPLQSNIQVNVNNIVMIYYEFRKI